MRRGLGVAVVPSLLLDEPEPAIATLPVDHFVPDRRIALTTRSNGARTPAVEFAAAIIRARQRPDAAPTIRQRFSGCHACQCSTSIHALSAGGRGSGTARRV